MSKKLTILFEAHFKETVVQSDPVKANGSDRKLFRLTGKKHSAIGVENADRTENIAFLEFSHHFHNLGLPVPEIYSEDIDSDIYLEEDLGDDTLFDLLDKSRSNENTFPAEIETLYEKVVQILPEFQIKAGQSLNYEACYPRQSFDRQSMIWDLNYFKYYFLKLAQVPFNEQKLEDDFDILTKFLMQADHDYFLYRDFQSRNIMIREGQPYFIDYQGGRRGALQYDIASLLFDAKALLPFDVRTQLLEKYLEAVSTQIKITRSEFMKYYPGYVLIRLMQAMGAYGFRGFYERKEHFLQSVPYAIKNLEYILRTMDLPIKIPTLMNALQALVRSTRLRELGNVSLPMTIQVQSFSYKKGLPKDKSGHGGGFIFDCRSLPNPGRLEQYIEQTGNDSEVIAFLENEEDVHSFLTHVKDLISPVIENYRERNFSHLSVAFGCTGGQHRSVYCANMLVKYLREKYSVKVDLRHRELERLN